MTEHERAAALMSAALDGAAAPEERAALAAHLAACPACRDLYADLAVLRAVMDETDDAGPAAGFAARTLERLPAARPAGKVLPFRRWRPVFAAAAAVALVAVALGAGGLNSLLGGQKAQAPMSTAAAYKLPAEDAASDTAAGERAAATETPAAENGLFYSSGVSPQESVDGAQSNDQLMSGMTLLPGSPQDETCKGGGCGILLPDPPAGDWAWILILNGEAPDPWPVENVEEVPGPASTVRYYSADASQRDALESALADRGAVSYTDTTTVEGAEKGVICLMPREN